MVHKSTTHLIYLGGGMVDTLDLGSSASRHEFESRTEYNVSQVGVMRNWFPSPVKRLLIRFESGPDYKGSTRESLMYKEYPCCTAWKDGHFTWVVELVVTVDLGSTVERRESSSLSLSTKDDRKCKITNTERCSQGYTLRIGRNTQLSNGV